MTLQSKIKLSVWLTVVFGVVTVGLFIWFVAGASHHGAILAGGALALVLFMVACLCCGILRTTQQELEQRLQEEQENKRADLWWEHVRRLVMSDGVSETRGLLLDYLESKYRIDQWDRDVLDELLAGTSSSSILEHGIPVSTFPGVLMNLSGSSYENERDVKRVMLALSSGFNSVIERYAAETEGEEDVHLLDEDYFDEFFGELEPMPEDFTEGNLDELGWRSGSFRPRLKQAEAAA